MFMRTSKILAICFLLFYFLMVNSSKLRSRQDKPACSDIGIDRANCDESKNEKGASRCEMDSDCSAGRKCRSKSSYCYDY